MVGGSKKTKIKKKYVELNEVGVYNSENDINSNPKTDDNKPDELTGFMSSLTDSIKNVIGHLGEIKVKVQEESQISYDSLDICIAELQSYVKSLEDETEQSSSATPN